MGTEFRGRIRLIEMSVFNYILVKRVNVYLIENEIFAFKNIIACRKCKHLLI